jgi:hypothetical protein
VFYAESIPSGTQDNSTHSLHLAFILLT